MFAVLTSQPRSVARAIQSYASSQNFVTNDNVENYTDGAFFFGYSRPKHSIRTLLHLSDVTCICLGYPGENITTVTAYESYIVQSYIDAGKPLNFWTISEPSRYSCLLSDDVNRNVWMISDIVGGIPLFYCHDNSFDYLSSSPSSFYTATNDALLLSHLGCSKINTMSSGQMISISLYKGELVNLHSWRSLLFSSTSPLNSSNGKNMRRIEIVRFAKRLFASLLHSLNAVANNPDTILYLEFDPKNAGSRLTLCAARALNISNYKILPFGSRVHDSEAKYMPQELRYLAAHLEKSRDMGVSAWKPSFHSLVVDRWRICNAHSQFLSSAAKTKASGNDDVSSTPKRAVFVSHDSGWDSHPPLWEAYLQNLICGGLGVDVYYAFGNEETQRILASTATTNSFFHLALDILEDENVCIDYADSIVTDSILSMGRLTEVTAVPLEVYPSSPRSQMGGDNKRDIESTSRESSQEVVRKSEVHEGYLGQLWLAAAAASDTGGVLAVVLATESFADMLSNFLCSVASVTKAGAGASGNFAEKPNLLVITPDETVVRQATEANVVSYLLRQELFVHFGYSSAKIYQDFGTLEYQELMLLRTEIVLDLMYLGFKPVIADIDVIWLRDPLTVAWGVARETMNRQKKSAARVNASFSIYNKTTYNDKSNGLGNGDKSASTGQYEGAIRLRSAAATAAAGRRSSDGSEYPFDVLVTDDNGEVCGCFVALSNSPNAINFWEEVTLRHRSLVSERRSSTGRLNKFSDSEQKIITDILLRGNYTRTLKVLLLPKEDFPSGLDFFNLHTFYAEAQAGVAVPVPAIVHNNYMIGKDSKISRFMRYDLWSAAGALKQYKKRDGVCRASATGLRVDWDYSFSTTYKDLLIPLLGISHPVHDTVIGAVPIAHGQSYLSGKEADLSEWASNGTNMNEHRSHRLVTQVLSEGFGNRSLRLWIENDPPAYVACKVVGIFDLSFNKRPIVAAFTAHEVNSNIGVHVDAGMRRKVFAFDRGGRYHEYANERVLSAIRDLIEAPPLHLLARAQTQTADSFVDTAISGDITTTTTLSSQAEVKHGWWDVDHLRFPKEVVRARNALERYLLSSNKEKEQEAPDDLDNESTLPLTFTIKVLAYRRPQSLLRLLSSLERAEYLDYDISLEVFVDGNRTTEDWPDVEATRRVAQSFTWQHGSFNTVFRPSNDGLANQWYSAWQPRRIDEAAFIFEDDTEVSPYFFVWARNAAVKYYAESAAQRQGQQNLLNAVRAHVSRDDANCTRLAADAAAARHEGSGDARTHHTSPGGAEFEERDKGLADSPLDKYARESAGSPLLYGICLQKQHLDPSHYPKRLEIRNGNRPFLYSLVGSWGPLMFPLPWLAFRKWWHWRSHCVHTGVMQGPRTENIVVNHFMEKNPDIWTPWFTRFAFETGLKCLYSNFPSNFSLVANHRADGENYASAKGSDSVLVTLDDVRFARASLCCNETEAPPALLAFTTDLLRTACYTCHHSESSSPADLYDKTRAAPLLSTRSIKHRELIESLRVALWHFPSFEALARWQFDFNLRRAGSLGTDKLFAFSSADFNCGGNDNLDFITNNPDTFFVSCPRLFLPLTAAAFDARRHAMAITSSLLSHMSLHSDTQAMSGDHWGAVLELFGAHVPYWTRLVHVSITPLLPLLLQQSWKHDVLLVHNKSDQAFSPISDDDFCDELASSMLANEAFAIIAAFKSAASLLRCRQISGDHSSKKQNLFSLDTATAAAGPTVAVVDISILRQQQVSLTSLWSALGFHSNPPLYLLNIGSCSAAPTDITVSSRGEGINQQLVAVYSIVEDACLEGAVDVGATLFKLMINSEGAGLNCTYSHSDCVAYQRWKENRFATSRRLLGSIATRRFIERVEMEMFS